MTREEVLSLIRSHLADELEIDPSVISEGTRFKEDLEPIRWISTRSSRSSRTPTG
jgi:hypothetical protein